MKKIADPNHLSVARLIVLLLFFDFFFKFVGYEYLADISPFADFLDAKIAATIGDVVFVALLLNIFHEELAHYFKRPRITDSIYYGLSLQIMYLGIMAPVGYLSLKINQDYFYNYWWEYKNIPIFHYSSHLFSLNFKLENAIFFVLVVFIAPIIEELTYRLVFYRVFRRKHSPLISITLVAAIFAAAHPTYFFLAFLASMSLSFLILRTGSVWSAIIAHGIYNTLSFIDSNYLGIGSFKPIDSIHSVDGWSIQLIFLPVFVLIVCVFFKTNRSDIKKLFNYPSLEKRLSAQE